jgi:hypothetical protein
MERLMEEYKLLLNSVKLLKEYYGTERSQNNENWRPTGF